MLALYRDLDKEKRMAFSKLRDYFTLKAKLNREAQLEAKRFKTMSYLGRWEDYRLRKDSFLK